MKSPATVLITGASSGIGRALALEYGRRGAHVMCVARRENELDVVCAAIEKNGGKADRMVCDVFDTEATYAMVGEAATKLGSLDMVIANAGKGSPTHASQLKLEDITRMMTLNAIGAMATIAAAIPIFLEQKRGHLVGMSSLAGRRALPGGSIYSASKAALSVFLEGMHIDLAPSGIRVTDVQPGFVATPGTANATHPRPFEWPVDKAATYIADKLESAPAIISFPLVTSFLTRLGQQMPFWLYACTTRKISGRG